MVRLLVGGNMNSAQMSPPQVKVSIISEQQVGILLKNNGVQGRGSELSSGEIVNNTGTMEYQKVIRIAINYLLNVHQACGERTENSILRCFVLIYFAMDCPDCLM